MPLSEKFQDTLFLISLATLFLAAGPIHSVAQTVVYSGSIQYSTGAYYFEETTKSFYLTNGFSMQTDRFTLSASFPFVVQSTPWVSYTQFGGVPTGGTQSGEVHGSGRHGSGSQDGRRRLALTDTTTYTRAGFSDPALSANYNLYSNVYRRISVSLNGQLKVPLANPSSGYGTGSWDSGLGLSASHGIGEQWMLFLSGMYWWMGDMPDLELNNTLAYGVSIGRITNGGRGIINASLNGFTKLADQFNPPLMMGMGAGIRASQSVYLNGNLTFGLSEASPDLSAGMGWSIRF
jgi:hypothetical protein